MTAKVVCICNLKGGVGKTTLVMALAEYLASDTYRKRVLAIDLDPQTNLTNALMSEEAWFKDFEKRKLTLPYLFKNPVDFLEHSKNEEFIVKHNVSTVKNNYKNFLHLIPSSPILFQFQEELPPDFYFNIGLTPINLISVLITPILKNYDYILIDCPPNINKVVKSAFLASHACILPCVPNRMSIVGSRLLIKHIEKFNQENGHHLKPLATLISRYNTTRKNDNQLVQYILTDKDLPKPFKTQIPEKAKLAENLDCYTEHKLTYKQKYDELHNTLLQLTQEFIEKVG